MVQRTEDGPVIKTYESKYISFQHKGTYTKQDLKATNNDLELAMLDAATNYQKRIAVAVSRLPSGNLDNHSAYKLRESDPTKYKRQDVSTPGGKAIQWSAVDGSETIVFIVKESNVAVLTFSTAGNDNDLQTESAELLKTFKWKL